MSRIVVSLPTRMRDIWFDGTAWDALCGLGEVVQLESDDDLAASLLDAEVLISWWRTPQLTADVIGTDPRLQLLAHTGSSLRKHVSDASWDAGIRVVQCGEEMADTVAETAVGLTLTVLHRTHRSDYALRAGETWESARDTPPRRSLSGATVGVVGASRTGRGYVRRVQALGAQVMVHDPYLDAEDAATLGVRSVALDELMSSSLVVALHLPLLPKTRGLIGASELALMADGAVLVNTARAGVLDSAALLAEVRAGRLDAALDVFEAEPLPLDSPWRSLPNVFLSPHVAGNTQDSRHRAGRRLVEAIRGRHEPTLLPGEITREAAALMA